MKEPDIFKGGFSLKANLGHRGGPAVSLPVNAGDTSPVPGLVPTKPAAIAAEAPAAEAPAPGAHAPPPEKPPQAEAHTRRRHNQRKPARSNRSSATKNKAHYREKNG